MRLSPLLARIQRQAPMTLPAANPCPFRTLPLRNNKASLSGTVISYSILNVYLIVCVMVDFSRLVYGTQRGDLGEVLMTPDSIRKGWTIPSESDTASISCITHCDISKDGVDDIIVGRDDGYEQFNSRRFFV